MAAVICLWLAYTTCNAAYSLFAPFLPEEVRSSSSCIEFYIMAIRSFPKGRLNLYLRGVKSQTSPSLRDKAMKQNMVLKSNFFFNESELEDLSSYFGVLGPIILSLGHNIFCPCCFTELALSNNW